MDTVAKTYQPFSNGTEFSIWHERNCQQCSRCNFSSEPTCQGDEALTLALFSDGQISKEIADFIGTDSRDDENGWCDLSSRCKEFQPA